MQAKSVCFILSLLLVLPAWYPVQAQTDVQVVNEEPDYSFNEYIDFSATVRSTHPVDEALIFVGPEGKPEEEQILQAVLDDQGKVTGRLDLIERPLQPFTTLEYRYQVTLGEGEIYNSPVYTLQYIDNRYQWQTLDSPPFRVHWYRGDISFAQEVLNVAHAGRRRLPEILEVYLPDELDIYTYSSAAELQAALDTSSSSWIAGHAAPDLGVILVSLPAGPDQRLEIERQIPHELMHVALYYTDAHTYQNLPIWLNEGLASLAELYPSPEYESILDEAFGSGELLSMASICQAFPTDSSQRLLAYAQSASFTSYLFEQYGTAGFNRLRAAFANNLGCRPAVENTLGASLESLEGQWLRERFTRDAWQEALADLLPWAVLAVVLLVGPIIMLFGVARRRPARMEL
jgi:hypothetical protein